MLCTFLHKVFTGILQVIISNSMVIENPRRGGLRGGGVSEEGAGAEVGVCGKFGGGGGLNIFCRARNSQFCTNFVV